MGTPGYFITLDGLDGTGKSTQCDLLAEWLREQGQAVTQCADPGSTSIGMQIRELVLHSRDQISVTCEMFLFMASRAQLTSEIIEPALDQGQVVISDRYQLANVVYQGHAGGLSTDLLWSIGMTATNDLQPDLTIILDLPVEVAAARRIGNADRLEGRKLEFHERVRGGFLEEARRAPGRIVVVDATGTVGEVQARLQQIVGSRLEDSLFSRQAKKTS
ncbi:MAG: dTMP kinase [Gemmataceae bacterium]